MYSTHIHTYMPASRRTCTHPHTQTNPLIRIHAHARTDTHRHASNYGNRRNKSLPRRSSKIAREFSTNFIRHYFSPCPLVLFLSFAFIYIHLLIFLFIRLFYSRGCFFFLSLFCTSLFISPISNIYFFFIFNCFVISIVVVNAGISLFSDIVIEVTIITTVMLMITVIIIIV